MKAWVTHTVRFSLVTIGIIVLTSVTIDATDTLRGSQTALSILAKKATQPSCPEGTVQINRGGDHSFCIDQFENSTNDDCAFTKPRSVVDTKNNIAKKACTAISIQEKQPWTYVNFHQAKELCATRGMRLPTNDEWYEAALGTPTNGACNIDGSLREAGATESCVSSHGVYDMIGNVWEWIDEDVRDGQYNDRSLPEEGYVDEADIDGVAIATTEMPNELYDHDYFWIEHEGVVAMMRGGFHGSGDDAGIYSIHTGTTPSFSSAAIGFRCVKDI